MLVWLEHMAIAPGRAGDASLSLILAFSHEKRAGCTFLVAKP